jgi:hypothetical protein
MSLRSLRGGSQVSVERYYRLWQPHARTLTNMGSPHTDLEEQLSVQA